ncbi:MAG: glycosyltransferase family 2 protein [Vulcanimicrobiaceae bacterium]
MTAVILTRNAAATLEIAIASLPSEMPVLVLDACSTDMTQAIARSAGATVIERAWTNFVDARAFALKQVRTPWAFALDADEACDSILAEALSACDGRYAGYSVLRDTMYRRRRLRMWRDEALVRLFRVENVRVEAYPTAGGSAMVHERYCIDGPVGTLAGHLMHDSYPNAQSYREKFAAYTQLEADGVPGSFVRLVREIVLFPFRWARFVFFRGALFDGRDGLWIASASAWYPVVVQWRALSR